MELTFHDEIIQAIEDLREVRVTFFSKKHGGALQSRRCAPMDYAPSQKAHNKTSRYHFWAFDSPNGPHTMPLMVSDITNVEVLDSSFDPSSFVTWSPMNWSVARTTWGKFN